jgi:hypothetical protein
MNVINVHESMVLREGLRKYTMGETVTDDELVEILRFLEPMERDGWVLDSRFTFFVDELRKIGSTLRGYQQQRITQGRWNPKQDQPAFLHRKEQNLLKDLQ